VASREHVGELMNRSTNFRSGFVSIIGRPNAGKSTLLNALAGHKLAIVSDKPQTTRTTIQAVLTLPNAQIVFIDTPGIHQSNTLFNKRMMETVRGAIQDPDLILLVVDCSSQIREEDREAIETIKDATPPVFLIANKIDQIDNKNHLLPKLEEYKTLFNFAEYFPISALTGEGLEELRAAIIARLPDGPQYFPADYMTDQPERFLAAELIREKILHETRQEVPHSVAVLIESWEDQPKLVRIAAAIYVERPGQKGIVIGAKGSMLKRIGSAARAEIEQLLAKRVFLELFVKVRPAWRESPEFLEVIDWRAMRGGKLEADQENS
jgi:GTP-binding protein Era